MSEELSQYLRESEERYRTLVEAASDAILSIDENRVVIFANPAVEKIFGYKVFELVGQNLSVLIPEDIIQKHLRDLPRFPQTSKSRAVSERKEIPARRRDGSIFSLEISFAESRQNGKPCYIGIARDISDRKHAEEVLYESQMMLTLAMRSSSIGAWEQDLATDVVNWNYELEEIFGLEKGAFNQNTAEFYKLVHEEDREKIWADVQNAIAEKRDYQIEFRFHHADGSVRWMEGRGQAVYSQTGEPVRLYGIGIDITERKQTEIALRESEERFSKAFSSSPLALTISSLETGELVEVNETFVNATGFSREEAIGKTTLELGVWAKPQEREAEMEIVRQQGQLNNAEYSFRTKNGDEIIGLLAAERIEIGGKPFALTVIQDITARKRSEAALIKAERKAAEDYQALLQRIVPLGQTLGTARDLISIYRAVLDFVRGSMSCSAFFVSFYDAEKSLRRAVYVWGEGEEVDVAKLPPMPLAPDGGANSQAIFGKKTVITNRYWDKQKKRPHVVLQENGINPQSSLVVPMMIKNETVGTLEAQAHENKAFNREQAIALEMAANLAAVAIENVRLLEVEANARRAAEDANRAKDEFLSVLSHELRTPLNAILGWIRIMKGGSLDESQSVQAIETIERNARLQNNLIEDLLDVSRIISGKLRIESEKINLATVVKSAIETVRPLAESKNISLEFEKTDASLEINGDATRLQQIVVNLANNAIKFTPANGAVVVALSKQGQMARLEIADTGIGISPDFLPHIFDRFRQADSTTQRFHNGLGLGLTIVRHLTELHNGRVYAESDGDGTGASFAIEIPLIEERKMEAEISANQNPFDNRAIYKDVLSEKLILLVDDDYDGIYPVKLFLEKHGARTVCAESANEALEKFAETKFDLLLSDIGMPKMDGYQLIEKVRSAENNSDIPAVALTAYASSDDRRRALTAGFETHIPKPINYDELLQIILNIFSEKKTND